MTCTLPDLTQNEFSKKDIIEILAATSPNEVQAVRMAAEKVLLENCGNKVYFRGLIEYSQRLPLRLLLLWHS